MGKLTRTIPSRTMGREQAEKEEPLPAVNSEHSAEEFPSICSHEVQLLYIFSVTLSTPPFYIQFWSPEFHSLVILY